MCKTFRLHYHRKLTHICETMALGMEVTIPATLAWFIVGALTFSSLQEFKNKKITTMVNKTAKLVMGAAFVGRMVPGSML